MEALIADGYITASLDITTTELADYVCGGVLSAGPERMMAAAGGASPRCSCPAASTCATSGAIDTIAEKYQNRNLYQWNPNVTLMRTNVEENRIGEDDRQGGQRVHRGPWRFCCPSRGSPCSTAPAALLGPRGRQGLLRHHQANVKTGIRVIEMDNNINDPAFADERRRRPC